LVNVSERDPLRYEPFPEGTPVVVAVEVFLAETLGGTWRSWYKGHMKAVPDAALWAQYKDNEDGRKVLTGLLLVGDAITADMLRRVPVTALENSATLTGVDQAVRKALKDLPSLERGERSPEEFSQLVAEHYKAWAQFVSHPVAAMAAEAKVKPATMHTWVREARLRGFLPPARRGKGR
jgi:hypothetical protein